MELRSSMIHHPLKESKEWVPSKYLPQIKRVGFLWVSKEGRRGTLVKGRTIRSLSMTFLSFFSVNLKEDKFSSLPHEF
jgi:hypothetical protein